MKEKYINLIKDAEKSNEYWTETAISDFTEELVRLMKKQGVTNSALAKKIGVEPPYITKVLRGNVNFTLATMTKLSRALGAVVRVHLAPDTMSAHWTDAYVNNVARLDVLKKAPSISASVDYDYKSTTSDLIIQLS